MKNEILAPCGDYDSFIAAINAGCDAVYLGLEEFSARKSAKNFTLDELAEVTRISNTLDIKVYVAVNTLVSDENITRVLEVVDEAYKLGVDALIVQDFGLINIFIKRYPDMEIHISTQVNITNYKEGNLFKHLGAKRLVLARELSVKEAVNIKEKTGLPIEVFGHGALCVCYSGNCMLSSSYGPRSGNLGDCAQSCRKQYRLTKDKKVLQEGYLLSTKDLATIGYLDEFRDNNIDSLKIEGRLKSKEYVYHTVSEYKQKMINPDYDFDIEKLKVLFNRHFTKGYLLGDDKYAILNNRYNNHQGVRLGKVMRDSELLYIQLEHELSINDGVRSLLNNRGYIITNIFIDNVRVNEAHPGDLVCIRFMDDTFVRDDVILLTKDYSLKISVSEIFAKKELDVVFTAHPGNMKLEYKDITVSSEAVDIAQKHANTEEELDSALTKTAKTLYKFNIKYNIAKNLYINNKELRHLKQEFIAKLDEHFLVEDRTIVEDDDLLLYKKQPECKGTRNIQIETMEQYEAIKDLNFDRLYIRNKELYKKLDNKDYYLVADRVIVDEFDETEKLLVSDFSYLESGKTIDYSGYLNIYNTESVKAINKLHPGIIYMSYEMDYEDIEELTYIDNNIGIVLYSRYDVMITKNDVVSNYLRADTKISYADGYSLEDDHFKGHPLISEGSNLRILNSRYKNEMELYEDYVDMGIMNFKIDFTNETEEEVEKVIHRMNLHNCFTKKTR